MGTNIYLVEKQNELENNEICLICHEDLKNSQIFEIPECKHRYHTNCLFKWFSYGNSKCPYCKYDITVDECICDVCIFSDIEFKYKKILEYCKKNNSNELIKIEVDNINDYIKNLSEVHRQINELRQQNGIYKEISKNIKRLIRKENRLENLINLKKKELCKKIKFIPFFIKIE